MSRYAKLVGKTVIPCSMEEWATEYEQQPEKRIVCRQYVQEFRRPVVQYEVLVSTVFLGINYGFGDEQDIWFETMAFIDHGENLEERCETYHQALTMHKRVLGKVHDLMLQELWRETHDQEADA
jgi:hypothetical protein